ncbi:MAG TPA: RusA family crossover junction endodeoxyribonuclease [Candidatus Eisenbergiella merdavium]|uniref:RusA family crossover junction endodeoxyribonuclease n=1 Tax=Candidatus Eisenbergiella merdavium TaxID=2838551 RepID=A0A9D2SQY0_9FIRM|nr:RusA family crossover junction endodeoxyribonuclease [Candidatus Eisenbergiella merdavium]
MDKTFACPLEDERKIFFFLPMIPPTVTHQEKQVRVVNGKPVFYEPAELKAARSKLKAHLAQHRPEKPYGTPVELVVTWCFPRGKHKDGEYRATKPDTDNLQKLLKDCMTDTGFWKDDCLVCREIVEKFWAQIPGIYIRIEELT